MNIARGIIAGLMGALIGAVVPVVVVATFTLLSWHFHDTLEGDRQYDIAWWRMHAVPPLVGAAIYLGLTAWATYTPKRNCGFAKTLAIIFFTSVPLTWLLAALHLTPTRYKNVEHPAMYFSELLLLLVPPLVMACVLVAARRSRAHDGDVARSAQ
jgi:predicted permease